MDHSPSSRGSELPRDHRGWVVSSILILIATVTCGLLAWSVGSGSPDHSPVSEVTAPASVPQPESPSVTPVSNRQATQVDAEIPVAPMPEPVPTSDTTRLSGAWTLDDGIQRRIEVRPDGTATMWVKLDALSAFVYGPELTLEVTWKLEGNRLTYIAISGKPEQNVARLLRDFGTVQEYTIIEFTEDHLLLELDRDQTRYDWRREQS